MSRYLGPKHKLCRRLGVKICDSPKCPLLRRNYPPGVHGPKGRPRLTAYGQQFREKQRARRTYGLSEGQFQTYYRHAVKQSGDTGVHLARMLEMRLDNVIYRLHWAQTRPQARQLVNHGFIEVNGKRVDVPSYRVKVKDVVSIRENKRAKKIFGDLSERSTKLGVPKWIDVASDSPKAKIASLPEAEVLRGLFHAQAVVELYSR